MVKHLEIELDRLRTNIIKMGSLVDEQIESAIKAVMESNIELAAIVIERDKKIDQFDNLVDAQCEHIFALSQPVAIDLRLIMSALKMNNELERIGDIAVNLSERVSSLKNHTALIRRTKLSEMSGNARLMVKHAIDSFVHNDPALARSVCERDDVVDDLNREIFQQLIGEMKADSSCIEAAAHLMILTRHLERLADHATNIAEDVVFLVDAKIIKHHNEG